MAYQAKPELTEIEEPDFHVCDSDECLNSYTPYEGPSGNRYCLTHAKEE